MYLFPTVRYHPDPIATGNIVPSAEICRCCGQARGYIYNFRPRKFCPWCIADGSAAAKFETMFVDYRPLAEAGLSSDIVEEVSRRTPGYISIQGEQWRSCCADACEFLGDTSREELLAASIDDLCAQWRMKPQDVRAFVVNYYPSADPGVFKFRCRHCGKAQYHLDFS